MRNTWSFDEIDHILGTFKGHATIDALRKTGRLGISRAVLVTDCCAMCFADPALERNHPDEAALLRQIYQHVARTGYLYPGPD